MTSMAHFSASTSINAPDAAKWPARRIVVFHGQHDTRIATGEDYASMSLADIFEMAPSDVDKRSSPACIPSTYRDHDAREHARQRQVGQFVALCGDVDTGNYPLERITDAVQAFAAGAAWLVYSSAHARDGDMRWRIIIPLSDPLPFARWHDVQSVFFATMEDAGITMDHALARAAQPVYLPNVPAIHAKSGAALRGADGRPIYYRRATSGTEAPGLDTSRGPVADGIFALVSKRDADERERKRIREIAEQRRANRPAGDSAAIIDGFNASNGVAAMLENCGYAQSPRDGRDWRSPMLTGETFATRVIEGKWVSLSASDVAAGVGTACASGCYGDAYDLFVHFKHGGDHKPAFRQLHSERQDEVGAKIIRGRFPPEPPPVDASDPGWQGMPEWANQTPSYADVGGMPEDGQAIDPAPLRGAKKPKPEPVTVAATPYVWRDPATIKPREWVYGRSIQRGHVRAILAPGAAGKTILSVGEALAMATGRNLLGQHVPDGPKRVWLWNLEDDGDELARIIQAACKHWSIGPEDIRDRLFVDSALEGAILKLATSTAAEGLVINRPLVAALTDEMLDRGIDYLHVDPFVSSHAANENGNMEIDAIAKEWALVAKNAKAGIGLAHHVSKAGAAEVTALSGRGAVSLINACRSVMVLNRMGEDEAKRWGIEDERRRRFFRVYDDKNNRAPPSDKSDWYTMASVSLGNGVSDDGDNMGVVIPWSPPDAFENVGADHLRRVQALVETGSYKESAQATEWVGKAVADVLGISADKSATADRAKINGILRVWYANGALVVVERRDPDKREMKKYVEVGIPAIDDAPPVASGAGQGGAGGAPKAPRPTCPPIGAGEGRLVLARDSQVGRGSTPEGQPPHGNPALKPVLAAGETGDEPIPGWEDV